MACRRDGQITECLAGTAPHASAQLMELAEAEILCVVYDDGVDIRHVYAALDDSGGEKDVIIVIGEIENGFLQFFGRHLPVGHNHACVRHETVDHSLQFVKPLDAVVDHEDLSVARHLEVHGLGEGLVGQRTNGCGYGIAVGGRCGYCRKIPRTHQRELKSSGNRGGTHCQRIDIGLHLFQLLLDSYAEFLLLIDHEKSQIIEFHRFADNFMGPDQNINLSGGKIGKNSLGVLCGTSTRQVIDPYGKILQSVGKSMIMLICEDGGGDKYGGLLVVGGSLEGGAYRHFRLSESDISADQAVHWTGTLHVGFHGLGGRQLVGGILVDEGCLQLMLHVAVGGKRESFLVFACGIELYEVTGYILQLGLCLLLHPVPRAAAEFIDFRRHALFAAVFGEFMERMDRDENSVVVGVGELYHLLNAPRDIRPQQTGEPADTVIDMDYVVARFNRAEFLERESELARASAVALEVILVETVENLMVGEQTGLGYMVNEAFVERRVGRSERYVITTVGENGAQTFDLLLAVGKDVDPVAVSEKTFERIGDEIEILMIEGLRRALEVDRGVGAGGCVSRGRELQSSEIAEPRGERIAIDKPCHGRGVAFGGYGGTFGEGFAGHLTYA